MEFNPEMFAKSLGQNLVTEDQATQDNVIDLTAAETVDNNIEGEAPAETSEDSSLTGGEAPEIIDTPADTDSPESVVNEEEVFKYLSERLGREVTSLDSFNQETPKVQEVNFASDRLKVINDFVEQTGRSVEDYMATQAMDVESMSATDAISKQLLIENPELSRAEVDAYIKHTYKQSEDDFTESERSFGKVQLMRDAKGAKDYFNKIKNDFAQPVAKEETQTAFDDGARKDWISTMEKNVNDLEGLSFQINDKEEFTYSFDDESRKGLVDHNSNLDNFFDKYTDKEGSWDFDKFNTDMFILSNFDKIIKSVANQYKGNGTEDVLNEITNPSFSPEKKDASDSKKSVLEQMAQQILGGNNSIWNK